MPKQQHNGVPDDENPEWTAKDFARARPLSDFPQIAAILRRRGPQKKPVKQLISLRLDPDVIDHFRAKGPGWQAKINATLRKAAGL